MPVLIKASRRHPFALLAMLIAFALSYYFASSVDTQALNKEGEDGLLSTQADAPIHSYSKSGSYLAARFARQSTHQSDAARLLSEALSHDPRNLDLRRDTIRQLVIAGQTAEGVTQVNKIPAMVHTHPLTRLVMLVHYLEASQPNKAAALLKAHKADGVFGLLEPVAQQWLALEMGDKTLLPMKLANLENVPAGYAARLMEYHMGVLNQAAGYDELAHEQLRSASVDIKKVPARMVYNYINLLVKEKEDALAEAMIAQYHQQFSNSHHIPKTLSVWKDYVEAKTLPMNAKDGIAEVLFSVGNVLFSANNLEETQFFLQLSLHLRPGFAPAQTLLARISEDNKDYAQAIALYRQVHPESIYAHQAAREVAINLYQQGETREAERAFSKVQDRFTANEKDLFAFGNLQRAEERYDAAIALYNQAIEISEKAKRPMWQLYFARGASYESLEQWDKAEADLLHALSLDANQPDVLNYLGYSWAEKGKNLATAREYVSRALRLAPNAGHIVDSMGWVEYRLGAFERAVKFLEHAVTLTPNDPTVNDHLGDALYRVGRKEEAKFQWKRALIFEPSASLTESLEEKLASGLPAFVMPAQADIQQEAAQAEQNDSAAPAIVQ